MKLIFCQKCYDLIALRLNVRRTCYCGESWGEYSDNDNALIGGKALPVGFTNKSFVHAVKYQPEGGQGKEFTAFIIPKHCPTVQYEEKEPLTKGKK